MKNMTIMFTMSVSENISRVQGFLKESLQIHYQLS